MKMQIEETNLVRNALSMLTESTKVYMDTPKQQTFSMVTARPKTLQCREE
jgi:hypothetical protein